MIPSSEHFAKRWGVAPIRRLAAALPDYEVRGIVFLRDQIDWRAAMYKHSVLHGNDETFAHYHATRAARLDYGRKLKAWEAVFGTDPGARWGGSRHVRDSLQTHCAVISRSR